MSPGLQALPTETVPPMNAKLILGGAALALFNLVFSPRPVEAAMDNYTGPDGGLWSAAANWTAGVNHLVPVNGDDVFLGTATGSGITSVTFNMSYAGPGLNSLTIDAITAATFTLNQGAGTAMIATNETFGVATNGAVYNQTGGTNTVAGTLAIGSGTGSVAQGNYKLSGGTLTATNEYIGVNTSGSLGGNQFNQTGGTNNVTTLTVGAGTSGSGTYNFSNGTLNVSSLFGVSGSSGSGSGTINQNGGGAMTNVSSGTLYIGGLNAGAYNLTAGSIAMNNSEMDVGQFGMGTFTQSGGSVTFSGTNGNLIVGQNNGGSTGNLYTLSNTGTISGAARESIGYQGTGTFTQTGGTNTISGGNSLILGETASGRGTYNLSAATGSGTLNADNISVGLFGVGTFLQTGGTANVTSSLTLGQGSGSTGTYTLNGGNLNVGTGGTATLYLGAFGTGTFNQGGGALTIIGASSELIIAGTYNLVAGTANAPRETLTGSGAFIQTGGTNSVPGSGSLVLNNTGAGTATYMLSGTGVLAAGNEFIGASGNAVVSQGIGTSNTAVSLYVGANASTTGTYNQTGGNLIATSEYVGYAGPGIVNQTGGNQIATSEYVGYTGPGVVNQSGGTNSISGILTIGLTGGGVGTYNLSNNGILNVNAANVVLTVGAAGTGVLNQTGGTLNARFVASAFTTGPTGTYHLSGGVENGDFLNNGIFIYDGGTFNGQLNNNGTFNLSTGFTAGSGVFNYASITVNPGGILGSAIGGGFPTDNEGFLFLSGGALGGTAPIVNNGFLSGYGTIGGTGNFTNNATLTQGGGTLVLSNSGLNTNNGTITLASGRPFQLSNASLLNSGTLMLNGATISTLGAGTLFNGTAGLISGPGTISSTFVNSGILQPGSGTLNVLGGFTNNGIIELTGFSSNLVGGAIANNGTVQGVGSVGNAVTNNAGGTIEALGGTLALGGSVTNAVGGTLAASTGNKLVFSAGLSSNAGIISLTGGTFDNNGHALTNNGQISGYGTFRTGGAGLTNAGSITFTGGQTTVNGNVINNGGQTIRVSYNPATFTGNVINNGTFKTTSTTVTFAGTFTNNGVFSSDPATQHFQDLIIGSTGALQGGVGDVFVINGTLNNQSRANVGFDIAHAQITLATGAHDFTWSAADRGATVAGYDNNFVVGNFELQIGATLNLLGLFATPAANALYVHALTLDGGMAQLSSIQSHGLNIYYDGGMAENAYLAWGTYALDGGGLLIAVAGVPEPSTYAMLLAGAGVLALGFRCRHA